MSRRFIVVVAGVVALAAGAGVSRAGTINLPNASFESPATVFVNTHIDSWQKTPKPDGYDESGGFMWDELTGVFLNTAPGSVDHIDNCDGNQAVWLFAVPQVGLFQDYNSVDWNDPLPTHEFDARFETGKSYVLTVGVMGGGGNMFEGASLELDLYYRDDASNQVVVAATSITNTFDNFPSHTHLTDYEVRVPVVKAGDAWAGRNIGVQLLSTVSSNLAGGYWDLDNVRLASGPVMVDPIWSSGQFAFTLQSGPGLVFDILASTNVALAASNWISLGTLTNVTGSVSFTDKSAGDNRRFYQVRQLP